MGIRHRVAKHKRGFVCIIYEGSRRRRVALEATDKWRATAEGAELVADIERKRKPEALTVGEIVERYFTQSEAISKEIDRHHWKAVAPHMSNLGVSQISESLCRSYAGGRSAKPGTIRKELSIVRAALRWAAKENPPLIDRAPTLWLPAAPPPKDVRLTREEAKALRDAANVPHLSLYIELALGTAARSSALLELRWAQIDMQARRIALGGAGRQKSRGRGLPINDTLHAVLTEAQTAALTPFVIEYAGKPVKSVKKAFRAAVSRAGLSSDVTPHTLRHTAASWMAETGVSMDEIAQFLGHTSPSITYRVYARFSPDYLQKAAKALG